MRKMMLFLSLALPLGAYGQGPVAEAADIALEEPRVTWEDLITAVQDPEADFLSLYSEAVTEGMAEADLVAVRTLYLLRRADMKGLLGLVPELEAQKDAMRYGEESIFLSKRHLLGLVESLRAIDAYQSDDHRAFEAAAKQAYWHWPEWPQLLHINELVMEERMAEMKQDVLAQLVIPMDTQIRQTDGTAITLAELAKDKKAILFDFWASWCAPCIRLLPELQNKADTYGPQGIFVAGLNTDQQSPLEKAVRIREKHEMNMPWLVDSEDYTMSRLMMIATIPHMVLISPEGKVLWSGHPMESGLQDALAKLGVNP